MSDRRLAQGQQPANRVDPDAEGIPKENPGPVAAAVPVGDGEVVVGREDLIAVMRAAQGFEGLAGATLGRLRAALNGEGTE